MCTTTTSPTTQTTNKPQYRLIKPEDADFIHKRLKHLTLDFHDIKTRHELLSWPREIFIDSGHLFYLLDQIEKSRHLVFPDASILDRQDLGASSSSTSSSASFNRVHGNTTDWGQGPNLEEPFGDCG
ncbi:MAG: hypothetical protein L6R41_006638 [Letrouitia leprolyta]|nr:MAG: hypothetical protein L6R41_006638 [Letrouitia leprolyta]